MKYIYHTKNEYQADDLVALEASSKEEALTLLRREVYFSDALIDHIYTLEEFWNSIK